MPNPPTEACCKTVITEAHPPPKSCYSLAITKAREEHATVEAQNDRPPRTVAGGAATGKGQRPPSAYHRSRCAEGPALASSTARARLQRQRSSAQLEVLNSGIPREGCGAARTFSSQRSGATSETLSAQIARSARALSSRATDAQRARVSVCSAATCSSVGAPSISSARRNCAAHRTHGLSEKQPKHNIQKALAQHTY